MAKESSNNTFAPIVITVLVAGWWGTTLLSSPPVHPSGGRHSIESAWIPRVIRSPTLLGDRNSNSSDRWLLRLLQPVRPLDQIWTPFLIHQSPLDPPQKGTPSAPLASDADPLGLGPTPTALDSGSNVPNANNPTNAEAKPSTSAESGGEQSEPVAPAEPNSEPKPTAVPVAKPKPVASTEV